MSNFGRSVDPDRRPGCAQAAVNVEMRFADLEQSGQEHRREPGRSNDHVAECESDLTAVGVNNDTGGLDEVGSPARLEVELGSAASKC